MAFDREGDDCRTLRPAVVDVRTDGDKGAPQPFCQLVDAVGDELDPDVEGVVDGVAPPAGGQEPAAP